MSCGIGRRCGSDPAFLWLWRKPEAAAPIGPLAWELPYATGVALKKQKRKRKRLVFRVKKEVVFFWDMEIHSAHHEVIARAWM